MDAPQPEMPMRLTALALLIAAPLATHAAPTPLQRAGAARLTAEKAAACVAVQPSIVCTYNGIMKVEPYNPNPMINMLNCFAGAQMGWNEEQK